MTSLFSLAGKTALITGAGRGIGQAIAWAMAQQGADIVLASRTESELQETAKFITSTGRRVALIPIDLREAGAAARVVDEAVKTLGGLDVLVTSAGAIVRKPALEVNEADWDTVIDLNLKARFFISQATARYLRDKGGVILHIASLTTFLGIPNQLPYVTGNGGLGSLTRAQATEWAAYNIRVNAIAPGTIVTRQLEGLMTNPEAMAGRLAKIPLNRLGRPEDVAGAAVFLASDAAAYITGHILVVDGGWLASGGGLKG
jgi:NAD(P)-dependent dehydrogenase (short-subunit alcohol dehydrogenase family)